MKQPKETNACCNCKCDCSENTTEYLAFSGYGFCRDCLKKALEESRKSGYCPRRRCTGHLEAFNSRLLYCPKCGAMVPREADEEVRAA